MPLREQNGRRGNPARDVEQFAIRTVTMWVGRRGSVVDTSAGAGPDFRIEYADGRVGLGEVGWHEDPVLQAMWGEVFKRPRPQQIALPPGLGQWGMSIVRGTQIKALYREAPTFIASLAAFGCLDLTVEGHWPRGNLGDTARRLGIEHVARFSEDAPAVAVFLFGGDGAFVPDDPNVVSDWIGVVFADANYLDMTAKLLRVEADERHVFLMSGSRTAFGVSELMRQFNEGLPTRSPAVPPGITHVWVVPQFGQPGTPGGMWSVREGWSTQPLPPE